MKTSELTGAALDWAVAQAEGRRLHLDPMGFGPRSPNGGWWIMKDLVPEKQIGTGYSPSTSWSQGGPTIDREGIDLYCNVATNPSHPDKPWRGSWRARYCRMGYGTEFSYGATALEAAMRCYVASKLGDEIEIPEGL